MKKIKCADDHRHVMEYKVATEKIKAGYYCNSCKYIELDEELSDDLLESQFSRQIKEL